MVCASVKGLPISTIDPPRPRLSEVAAAPAFVELKRPCMSHRNQPFVVFGGGQSPISRKGEVIGAVGVAGGMVPDDEAIAAAVAPCDRERLIRTAMPQRCCSPETGVTPSSPSWMILRSLCSVGFLVAMRCPAITIGPSRRRSLSSRYQRHS